MATATVRKTRAQRLGRRSWRAWAAQQHSLVRAGYRFVVVVGAIVFSVLWLAYHVARFLVWLGSLPWQGVLYIGTQHTGVTGRTTKLRRPVTT